MLTLMSRREVKCCQKDEVNCVPLSKMIDLGEPCSQKISQIKRSAVWAPVMVLCVGMKWACFVRRSLTTRMESNPLDMGRSVMKSMEMSTHRSAGTGRGLRRPYGAWRDGLAHWQTSQLLIIRQMDFLRAGQ